MSSFPKPLPYLLGYFNSLILFWILCEVHCIVNNFRCLEDSVLVFLVIYVSRMSTNLHILKHEVRSRILKFIFFILACWKCDFYTWLHFTVWSITNDYVWLRIRVAVLNAKKLDTFPITILENKWFSPVWSASLFPRLCWLRFILGKVYVLPFSGTLVFELISKTSAIPPRLF
jgi:hypothetical protein